jgi:hypothetical protein
VSVERRAAKEPSGLGGWAKREEEKEKKKNILDVRIGYTI